MSIELLFAVILGILGAMTGFLLALKAFLEVVAKALDLWERWHRKKG